MSLSVAAFRPARKRRARGRFPRDLSRVDIALLLRPFCSTHDAAKEIPMNRFSMLALAAIALFSISGSADISAGATPLSVTGFADRGGSNVEFVRRHRRESRTQGKGVPVFIVPGFYWGPAWWDANYWRQSRSRRNCGNWFLPC
jgi:hypothetical protein